MTVDTKLLSERYNFIKRLLKTRFGNDELIKIPLDVGYNGKLALVIHNVAKGQIKVHTYNGTRVIKTDVLHSMVAADMRPSIWHVEPDKMTRVEKIIDRLIE